MEIEDDMRFIFYDFVGVFDGIRVEFFFFGFDFGRDVRLSFCYGR